MREHTKTLNNCSTLESEFVANSLGLTFNIDKHQWKLKWYNEVIKKVGSWLKGDTDHYKTYATVAK